MKKKLLIVFGTRPEAIKVAPVIKEIEKYADEIELKICITAQHRQMLDKVLDFFEIKPDYDLNIMKESQDLFNITEKILKKIKKVLEDYSPDIVIVHGDTTTTFAASLAAFYKKIDVAHIEAGLRSYDIYSPWPEEINRKLTTSIAKFHFAPTDMAKKNLIKENIPEKNIVVTGNTVIDALFFTLRKIEKSIDLRYKIENYLKEKITKDFLNSKIILVTGHRRESFGEGIANVCKALKYLAKKYPDINIVYPVHLNPNVQKPVKDILKNIDNIFLIEPLNYEKFVYLMKKSYIIVTDSGGIQEEAPSLGKPVVVTREVTERVEAIKANKIDIVGTDFSKIVENIELLLNDEKYYKVKSKRDFLYGDGKASQKIVKFLQENL